MGSAAGGGLPQWNCACPNCADAWAGRHTVRRRTQSSITVSSGGEHWVLFNASPDLRLQIESFPPLQPGAGPRSSGISAVFLTDAELDHAAGLLLLREGRELRLYCTGFVREALAASGLLATVEAYLPVRWTEVVPGDGLDLEGPSGGLGLRVRAFEVDGDPPRYWGGGDGRAPAGSRIGVRIEATPASAALVYVPGAGAADAGLLDRIGAGDSLLWDGTFWTDDELARLGISDRTASSMGHLPLAGPGGALERFRGVSVARKAFVHINNTNPILREASPERREAEAAGWEVGFDGMEFDV